MESLTALVSACSNFIWGVPMLVMLFGTHLFLTVRLRLVQRHIPKAIRLSLSPDEGSQGEISQFGALATALAATIGTGNIIGVSTAIALGGPGAVLWCWLTGVFGIATKYGEALLAVKYRTRGKTGAIVGGPMYTIERGLGWKWLAVIFAAFTVLATFGAGCTVQSHAITDVIHTTFGVAPALSGLVVTAITAVVILGGVKAIAKVCEKLVPFMSLFYILGCIAILVLNAPYLGEALVLIVKSAFGFQQIAGGFVGGAMMAACRYGMARGLFSNESGLGTAPIAAATAQTKNSVRQALVSMTGTFWDTVIVCAMTGIVVVSSMVKQPQLYEGASDDAMTRLAFANLPAGQIVLALALSVFAFTTILGWSYYGERCVEYLFGPKGIPVYRLVFLVVLFIGAVANLDLVWSFADLMNGLMAFPNLISVLLLSGVIVAETRHYLWEDRLDEQSETID
ncbi:alanine/glycine:cation symporter family protein [Gemmiger sp. An194]|uniref:alanine/glycine:cation symporter family protein n=1 Tax=Gemmiger sp. An194 TaxID=1965582 RepID=UPI000B369473|nr:alanine/glycine:cation symporter family protein [Gemmiger sp. An194]OUP25575.1 sodium:alanine symporter family protein [Gemmiger sp. An194]